MCGIAGFINSEDKKNQLALAIESLKHRGPDELSQVSFMSENQVCGLGMARLSIVDLADGHQPYFNESREISVVFNGEIYNHAELRKRLEELGHKFNSRADGEVIPHLYEEYGMNFPKFLDGMFAIALWDTKNHSLILCRDRFGKKPLYFGKLPDSFAFASELKALVKLFPDKSLEVDSGSLLNMLQLGFVAADQSIYKGIQKLLPGHIARYKSERLEIDPFWLPFSFREKTDPPGSTNLDDITESLRLAVQKRLPEEVDFGVFLSGGIDSGLVAWQISELGFKDIPSYSVSFDDGSLSENAKARATSKLLGFEHRELRYSDSDTEEFWGNLPEVFDEPNLDSSIFPTLFLAREASKDVKVVLTGDGGDELFGGYPKYSTMQLINGLTRHLPELERVHSTCASARIQRIFEIIQASKRGPRSLSRAVNSQYFRASEIPCLTEESESMFFQDQVNKNLWMDLDLQFYLPGILQKIDMSTMHYSLEARSPLLDFHLYEKARRLADSSKYSLRSTKILLRELANRVLPKNVAKGQKRGFTPNRREILNTGLRLGLGTSFENQNSLLSDLLSWRIPSETWEAWTKDIRQERKAWALIVVEQWLKNWTQ